MNSKSHDSKYIKNNLGFALIEVMVAAGILGIISLGVMKTMENMQKSSKKLAQDSEVNAIWNVLQQTMRDQKSCSFTLTHKASPSSVSKVSVTTTDSVNAIYRVIGSNPDSNPADRYALLKINTDYGTGTQGTIELKSLATEPVNNKTLKLIATFEKKDKGRASYGGQNIVRSVNIHIVDTNGDNKVDECYVDEKEFQRAACTMLGGNYDQNTSVCTDIKIGDGTDTPTDDTIAVTVKDDLEVTKNSHLAGNLTVDLNTTVKQNLTVNQDLTVKQNATIQQNATVQQNLSVTKTATIGQDLGVGNNAKINEHLGIHLGGSAINSNYVLEARGKVKLTQGSTYDVWIQGGSATSGGSRNLALLGNRSSDKLYLNYGGEYSAGVNIGNSVSIANNGTITANTVIVNESQPDNLSDSHAATAKWVRSQIGTALSGKLSSESESAIINHLKSGNAATQNREWFQDNTIGTLTKVGTTDHCGSGYVVKTIHYDDTQNRLEFSCVQDQDHDTDTRCDVSNRCNYVYSKYDVKSSRDVTASRDVKASRNIVASGYVYASNYVQSGHHVYSGSYYGFCNRYGCRTTRYVYPYSCSRIGDYRYHVCTGRRFFIGVDHGNAVCCYAVVR